MLTFKKLKRKLHFTFLKRSSYLKPQKKDYIGSPTPSEKKYEELIAEYGDDPSYTTALGIKIFPTGDQFVIDAKTNRVIVRDKSTRYLGRDTDSGFHLYIAENSELKEGDEAHPSFVKEKELI